ncbi:MAG: YkgJ family cysteine cluster protein [bacterium]|nr:YkgJ family cysteine cluster protein [bacterium]
MKLEGTAAGARQGARAGRGTSDAELLRVLDREFAVAAQRAGEWLVCAPGCAECCHGPFPVTRLDRLRLENGLARMRAADPPRAAAIRERARGAVRRMEHGFPGDVTRGRPAADESRLDAFFERHAALACPALEPQTGRCELYDSRPVACRTYGPPLSFGGREAPHCHLCFDGADEAEVARCRIEPDREGLESELLAGLGVEPSEEWDTLIAFVLREE